MLFNMDAELQHLITISMEKMTSGASSSVGGHGNKKSRGMDLRKALLVAHFLQEVRCAYFDEDYEIVANTIKGVRSYECEDDKILKGEKLSKHYDRCTEETRTYFMDEETVNLPSSSVYQSCVTNSDMMVSRMSQATPPPLAISINTDYVISPQTLYSRKDTKDEKENCYQQVEEDVPAFCEELEVSSSCDDANSAYSDECTQEVTTSLKQEDFYSNSRTFYGNKSNTEVVMIESEHQNTMDYIKTENKSITEKTLKSETRTSSCPLPKKKRPLPKEFWDSDSKPAGKTPKTNDYTLSQSSKIVSNQYITNTFATSIANTVTLESKTSTSLSTVCSVIGTAPLLSGSNPRKSNPKVVVQITQSCDSFLPISCSKLSLERRLTDMTTRTF